MPLYEYKCTKHGKFEMIKPMNDGATACCPDCGEISNKILSPCNWSFGWRLTDRCHERGGPREEFEKNV